MSIVADWLLNVSSHMSVSAFFVLDFMILHCFYTLLRAICVGEHAKSRVLGRLVENSCCDHGLVKLFVLFGIPTLWLFALLSRAHFESNPSICCLCYTEKLNGLEQSFDNSFVCTLIHAYLQFLCFVFVHICLFVIMFCFCPYLSICNSVSSF